MKTVLRIALAALAIVGFAAVEALGQKMPVQAALAEFGLPGQWAAPSCAQPFVVLTFESSPTSQFVIRRDKDGARFDITGATKLQNDVATLELRRTSVFHGGRWQATSAADASEVLTYAFGKRGNNLGSTSEESASARRARRCVHEVHHVGTIRQRSPRRATAASTATVVAARVVRCRTAVRISSSRSCDALRIELMR